MLDRAGMSKVVVRLSRDAPEYSEGLLLNRDYEAKLHQHYDRPGYWVAEHAAAGAR